MAHLFVADDGVTLQRWARALAHDAAGLLGSVLPGAERLA